jgi:hypothetical protein
VVSISPHGPLKPSLKSSFERKTLLPPPGQKTPVVLFPSETSDIHISPFWSTAPNFELGWAYSLTQLILGRYFHSYEVQLDQNCTMMKRKVEWSSGTGQIQHSQVSKLDSRMAN